MNELRLNQSRSSHPRWYMPIICNYYYVLYMRCTFWYYESNWCDPTDFEYVLNCLHAQLFTYMRNILVLFGLFYFRARCTSLYDSIAWQWFYYIFGRCVLNWMFLRGFFVFAFENLHYHKPFTKRIISAPPKQIKRLELSYSRSFECNNTSVCTMPNCKEVRKTRE